MLFVWTQFLQNKKYFCSQEEKILLNYENYF